jgi:hypothetical protein
MAYPSCSGSCHTLENWRWCTTLCSHLSLLSEGTSKNHADPQPKAGTRPFRHYPNLATLGIRLAVGDKPCVFRLLRCQCSITLAAIANLLSVMNLKPVAVITTRTYTSGRRGMTFVWSVEEVAPHVVTTTCVIIFIA